MVNKSLLASLLFCVAVNSGCYLAAYPIDEPPVTKVDERYLGKWYAESKKKKSDNVWMDVVKQDEFRFRVVLMEKKQRDTFNAFLSVVNDARFLNLYNDDEPRYAFCRILNATAEMLTVAMVADTNMATLTSSAAVRERITQHLNDPSFYGDTSVLRRRK